MIQRSLLDEITRGRASLVLGAGASCEADFPTAWELGNWLVKQAGEPHESKLLDQPLDIVTQYFQLQRGYGKEWVRKQIITLFNEKHRSATRPPSHAHQLLTTIRWRTIFTTNFDRLIELTYDCTPNAVQRHLPVYAPDPLVLRHEEDVVRIVKLNGSTDEAERNAKHDLVLTFPEQQSAAIHNKLFYDLLREESINGPLIFIGFRFIHPGTNVPGTSLEFQQLQNLVRVMGSAARWHYCITPEDRDSIAWSMSAEILRDCQIEVIPATFGEFMAELAARMDQRHVPLIEREMIEVPVGTATLRIDPEDYSRDKRHFELIHSQIEEIKPPSVADSLNGRENWGSFIQGHLIERLCKDDFRRTVSEALTSSPEIVYIGAPAGWGKSFLLRDFAVEMYWARRPVIWLNPYAVMELQGIRGSAIRLGAWDTVRIDRLLGSITELAASSGLSAQQVAPVIIADNCGERAPEILSLFRSLSRNNRQFVILFSVRDSEYEDLQSSYPLLRRAKQFLPVGTYPSRDEVESLVDFCRDNKVALVEDVTQREAITATIVKEEADTSLILALQIIFDRQHRPFSEIVSELWDHLPTDWARELVLRVASLHRFGSTLTPRLYSLLLTFPEESRKDVLEAYNACLRSGVLFERLVEHEPVVHTVHSLVAERISTISGIEPQEVDRRLLDLVACMTPNPIDLEIIRRLIKRINDYEIQLSSEDVIEELFHRAAQAMNSDWVVSQQFAKYLIQRGNFAMALTWAERAIEANPEHSPLQHTKGNVLRRWGMELLSQGQVEAADERFADARESFATSRITREPDEYGYVTHLEMLMHLQNNTTDTSKKASLLAEGITLYEEGLRAVPKDKYNLLLDERFQKSFDVRGSARQQLCQRIEQAAKLGRASKQAVSFLISYLMGNGDHARALAILRSQRELHPQGALLWVKEAEVHARCGAFQEAIKAIDSARRREKEAETIEVLWSLLYWDLIISMAIGNYPEARTATLRLSRSGFFKGFRGHLFPRGYFWQANARGIPPADRSFKEHARIWTGRVQEFRPQGSYGQISLRNPAGEDFNLEFNPRYFGRKDLRAGDFVRFVITILPTGLRADDPESKPFVNTIDDIYIRERAT